jgi:hypothetical protein
MLGLPVGIGSPGRWSGPILLLGIAASMSGLAKLAISGFAPAGTLPLLVLVAVACGVIGTLLSGRPPPRAEGPAPVRPDSPAGRASPTAVTRTS